MRYLYKQTGVVVESSIKLDSSIFTPASANQKGGEETEARAESVKKTARKAGTQLLRSEVTTVVCRSE